MTYMLSDADTAFYPGNGADCPERLYNGLGCVPPAEDAPPDPHGKERQGRDRAAGSQRMLLLTRTVRDDRGGKGQPGVR